MRVSCGPAWLKVSMINHLAWDRVSQQTRSRPTLSLCSLRLTMTAVICWSMKSRMVTSRAGTDAARYTHQGFPPNGGTNQPRFGLVGWGHEKTAVCGSQKSAVRALGKCLQDTNRNDLTGLILTHTVSLWVSDAYSSWEKSIFIKQSLRPPEQNHPVDWPTHWSLSQNKLCTHK